MEESTKTILRGITRCAELIEKNHPEIAEKIRAKDVPTTVCNFINSFQGCINGYCRAAQVI